jgi:hypothetical protein
MLQSMGATSLREEKNESHINYGDTGEQCEPFCMSSTNASEQQDQISVPINTSRAFYSLTILSQCFRAASKPSLKSLLNSIKASPSNPPRTSIYSRGNLNGAASKPIFPGEFERRKPKSMCITWLTQRIRERRGKGWKA